ncbi:MAG: hypothetical protein WBH60_04235 [Fervidobacterium sp.]
MKGYVRIVLVATLLLLSTALLAALNVTGLWNPNFSWQVPGKLGPSLITQTGGNLYFLSKDGALYELKTTGEKISLGQADGITNVVAPATYVKANSKDYIVYVTAQGTENNKIVVHKINGTSPVAKSSKISSSAYGVVTHESTDSSLTIYTATMDGTVYKVNFEASNSAEKFTEASSTVHLGEPIKIPPILSKNKDVLYVLTQRGKFYTIPTTFTNFGPAVKKLDLNTEFTVPMAMDESGIIYALSTNGTLYRIDPSGVETHASGFLNSSDSAGVLIDGNGYIYTFGGGKVVAYSPSLLKLGDYTIGQKVTTTPAIAKGTDGKTYIIIPSSQDNSSGKITILSFDSTAGLFTKEWEYVVPSSFPISAAVSISPTGTLSEDYYFATATNDGTVYAWKFNCTGPFGIWAMYGQNTKHTGFIDATAMDFKTRIYIKVYEGLAGRELSKSALGNTNYGLLYDASILNIGDSGSNPNDKKTYRTNEDIVSQIPEGNAGSQRLWVEFSTPTTATLLLDKNKLSVIKGTLINSLTKDATFAFSHWESKYELSDITDNPATFTFRFSDRNINAFADATYTYYVYHNYPGDVTSEAKTIDKGFKYNGTEPKPDTAKITIAASTSQAGQQWYPFKWNVYQWNPAKPGNYEKSVYGDKNSIDLRLNGPAYIEIYYAQLSATITLLIPEFAYGRTPAYLFLDAATNSIAYTLEATMLNGVTIEKVLTEEYATSTKLIEKSISSNHLRYVFNGMESPLKRDTRVATLALNLIFPEKTDFRVDDDEIFEQYANLYGYAQLQGQLIDSQGLMARKEYKTNKFLYVLGNFDDDFDVDINDWNFFIEKYGTTVSGTDVIYNIGPRDDFVPPYPNYQNYSAGFLIDNTDRVNEEDLYVFASMFGFVVPDNERLK